MFLEVIIIQLGLKVFIKSFIVLFFYFSFHLLYADNYKVVKEIGNEELYEITEVKGSNCNIFIAQRTAANIIKLDSSGLLMKIIGGKGKGPGEYDSVNGICILNDQLIVKDNNLRRITVLTCDGEYLNSFNIDVTGNMNIGDSLIYINNPVIMIKSDYSNKISVYNLRGNKIKTLLYNDYNGGEINKALIINSCYSFISNENIYCFKRFQRVIDVYDISSEIKILSKIWDKKFSLEIPNNNNSQRISFYNNPAFVSMINYKECYYCVYFNENDNNLTRIAKFASDISFQNDIIVKGIFPYIFVLDNKLHMLSEDFILIKLLID